MPGDPALDDVTAAVRAYADLINEDSSLICIDFADIRIATDRYWTGGAGVFGTGEAEGPDRAVKAAEAALADFRARLQAMGETGDGAAAHCPPAGRPSASVLGRASGRPAGGQRAPTPE